MQPDKASFAIVQYSMHMVHDEETSERKQAHRHLQIPILLFHTSQIDILHVKNTESFRKLLERIHPLGNQP